MNFARGGGRWLLSLLIGLMVTAWISVCVLQITVLNRVAVSNWLVSSSVYQNALGTLLALQDDQGFITANDLQQSLNAAFPPAYVQQQTEVALNATYNWLEGKTPNIQFSIPLKDKRPEFSAHLKSILEAKLVALPACPGRTAPPDLNNPSCMPADTKPAELAAKLSQLAETSDFLDKPITPASLSQKGQPDLSYLPKIVNVIQIAVFALPVAIALCAAGYAWLSKDKIRGLAIVGRHMFFQGLLVDIGASLLMYYSTAIDLSAAATTNTLQQILFVQKIINPVIQQVVPDVSRGLIIFGGVVATVGGLVWLVTTFAARHRDKKSLISPVPPTPVEETPKKSPPLTPPTI